jgi:hypothetical protein
MMDNDNASILSAATAAIERYRNDERAMEVEIAILQTRLEATREFIAALSGKPRARRGRSPRLVEQAEEAPAAELMPVA